MIHVYSKPNKPVPSLSLTQLKNVFQNSYSIGLEISDNTIKENALINILALDVTDTISVYNLLDFYFKNNSYLKSFLLSKKYLEDNRYNIKLLDYNAKSAEMIDRYADAKAGYQKLYIFTSDTYYAYLDAYAEYMLGNFESSLLKVYQLENNSDTKIRYVSFSLDDDKSQDIVVYAAIYYLKGLILEKLNKSDESQLSFQKAIEIQPDFISARNQIK
jgi:tetratricopeptide (TPR) repeat protein